MSELLNSGYTQLGAKNPNGQTATHLAAIDGQNDILALLIESQVNVNLRDAMGFTPLHVSYTRNLKNNLVCLILVCL